MNLEIRHVRPAEYRRAGEIVLASYRALSHVDDDYADVIVDTGSRVADGAEVWVAVDGALVLGAVTFVDGDNPHFENAGAGDCGFRMLGVDPAAQGRGAGRALVQRCIDRGIELGRRRLAIYSMAWMPAAHVLYDSLGFTRRPDRDVLFPMGVGVALQRDLVPDAHLHFPPPGPPADPPRWYLDAWEDEVTRGVR